MDCGRACGDDCRTWARGCATAHRPAWSTAASATPAARARYRLYRPGWHHLGARPLVVMLHGCRQNPDDFAAGTRMHERGKGRGCFVLYPGQDRRANRMGCWNWFEAVNQQRESGEPSILADMTREVIARHRIDPNRVYVAGLSAGGAMAAILATTHPELFAAVGIHSGLPHAAASNLTSALLAMKRGPGRRRARPTGEPVRDGADHRLPRRPGRHRPPRQRRGADRAHALDPARRRRVAGGRPR